MKRRFLTLLAVVAMLFTFAPVVNAGTQGSCSPGTSGGSVRLWENATTDHGDGDDSLYAVCNAASGVTNLGNVGHTLAGGCAAGFKIGDNWNDCVSHWTVWLANSSWRACLYRDANYSGLIDSFQGPQTGAIFNLTGNKNDAATSVRVTFLLAC